MYRLARILTQSSFDYLMYPGRIVKVRIGYGGEVLSGYKYIYCGMSEVYIPKIPDFEFELVDE